VEARARALRCQGAAFAPHRVTTMKRLLTVLLAVSLFAGGCGSSSPTVASTPSRATSSLQTVVLSFSEDFSLFTKAGATAQVSAIGIFANLSTQDVTATCTNWLSAAPSVLTVNSGGLMMAQSSSGSATITTTCQGVSASGLVTVNQAPSPPLYSPAPSAPLPASCTQPPYTWDSDTASQFQRCHGSDGKFADNACCGH
jgi:hypothetical protein